MPIFSRRLLIATVLLALTSFSLAYFDRDELHRRQINVGSLKPAYDYIVVGGGQSGLVIANRLSEDSSSKSLFFVTFIHFAHFLFPESVLIVEYGTIDDTPSQVEPSSATSYAPRNLFNVTSVPQPGIGNKRSTVYAAAVVGGGSTINGMLFDRGAAEDYDNWEKLNNTGWGWAGLLPYFKKVNISFSICMYKTLNCYQSTRFNTPIDPAIVAEYNQTWDTSVYGTDGPIQVTYPPWVWPGSSKLPSPSSTPPPLTLPILPRNSVPSLERSRRSNPVRRCRR